MSKPKLKAKQYQAAIVELYRTISGLHDTMDKLEERLLESDRMLRAVVADRDALRAFVARKGLADGSLPRAS